MKAIVVEKYGSVENLIAKDVPDPGTPTGRELLVRVEACSVNPVDVKVRAGKYDDYPCILLIPESNATVSQLF
ncbi:hypothetical protein VTN96DRAFT_2557 [Rasamsonia emersonii]